MKRPSSWAPGMVEPRVNVNCHRFPADICFLLHLRPSSRPDEPQRPRLMSEPDKCEGSSGGGRVSACAHMGHAGVRVCMWGRQRRRLGPVKVSPRSCPACHLPSAGSWNGKARDAHSVTCETGAHFAEVAKVAQITKKGKKKKA